MRSPSTGSEEMDRTQWKETTQEREKTEGVAEGE